jgi:hypothetical protein
MLDDRLRRRPGARVRPCRRRSLPGDGENADWPLSTPDCAEPVAELCIALKLPGSLSTFRPTISARPVAEAALDRRAVDTRPAFQGMLSPVPLRRMRSGSTGADTLGTICRLRPGPRRTILLPILPQARRQGAWHASAESGDMSGAGERLDRRLCRCRRGRRCAVTPSLSSSPCTRGSFHPDPSPARRPSD